MNFPIIDVYDHPHYVDSVRYENYVEIQEVAEKLEARVARLEELVQRLLDEDPNEQIADNGSTVLCAWRYDVRRALEEK